MSTFPDNKNYYAPDTGESTGASYANDYSGDNYGTMTVKDLPADLQPRERAKRFGMNSLSNADLFAIILRTGLSGYPVTDLCRDMMKMNGNKLRNLERKTLQELMGMGIKGIGELKAMQIGAVMELVKRYNREEIDECPKITQSTDIYNLMRHEIGNLPYEEMWALFLNRQNCVTSKIRISEGGSTATVFDVKKVVRNAILAHAEGVILCHNHPSGNLRPSGPDDQITRKFKEACKALEISFLDHLIITGNGYFSYSDSTSIIR